MPAEPPTARAQRYRDAIRRVEGLPDAEAWWPVARTFLARVLEGDTDLDRAWREVCADYGIDPSWT